MPDECRRPSLAVQLRPHGRQPLLQQLSTLTQHPVTQKPPDPTQKLSAYQCEVDSRSASMIHLLVVNPTLAHRVLWSSVLADHSRSSTGQCLQEYCCAPYL